MATKSSITLRFDYRWIVAGLLLIIAIMVLLWRPWEGRYGQDARTVTVTGDATIKAAPDQYEFYPTYTVKNTDITVAKKEIAAKSTEIVGKLKELGVADNAIKTTINNYPDYGQNGPTDQMVYSLNVQITVKDTALMEKVLGYIETTNPEGAVTPQPTFSTEKRKQLEQQAREQATKEARSKADQSAKNLGFRVADVKSVNDGSGFGPVTPYPVMAGDVASKSNPSTEFMPGENDLVYSVTVEYYIR